MSDDTHDIFTDLPEGLGEDEFYFGAIVPGMGGMVNVEVARAFATAANRLVDAAESQRESWEAAYPILFCYRHALELYLKALLPSGRQGHRLGELFREIKPLLAYFSPSWTAFQADRGRAFSVIVDGVSG